MNNGFWGWFLVIVILVLVFGANKLPTWVEQIKAKAQPFLAKAAEKKAEIEKKIAEKKSENK